MRQVSFYVCAALAVLAGAKTAFAAEPLRPEQFAEAMVLTPEAAYPVQQLLLPDAVYQRAVSPALNDVAVFNADGQQVPHGLCSAAPAQTITEARQPLTVFPVRLAQGTTTGATAELHTERGSRIAITVPGEASQAAVAVTAYDLDLSAVQAPASALLVQWHSPTGLSEVHLRVEQAADGGSPWQPVVGNAVLKRVTADGQTLEQAEIVLPTQQYKTLRLTPFDASGTVIDAVVLRTRSISTLPVALRWFTALPRPAAAGTSGGGQFYDAAHRAPVTRARVDSSVGNSRAAVRLMSRAGAESPWLTAWAGDIFYLLTSAGARRNDDVTLPEIRDRDWLLVGDDAAGGAPAASLQLGYAPETLRFLAQGAGPYRLVYGNAAATGTVPGETCDSLLKNVFDVVTTPPLPGAAPSERPPAPRLIGNATAGDAQRLAGEAALQAPAMPASAAWRRWLLWGVLALAVVLLLGMARKLMADLKQPQ